MNGNNTIFPISSVFLAAYQIGQTKCLKATGNKFRMLYDVLRFFRSIYFQESATDDGQEEEDEDLDELQLRFLALASAANANKMVCEVQ